MWFDASHEEVGTLTTLKLFLETTHTHTIVGLATFKQNKVEKSSFIGSSLIFFKLLMPRRRLPHCKELSFCGNQYMTVLQLLGITGITIVPLDF